MKAGAFLYLSVLTFLTFLIFQTQPAYSKQQKMITISPQDIVRIAVENIEKNDKLKREFVSFERTFIQQELDRDGRFKSVMNRINGKTTKHGYAYSEDERDKGSVEFFINLNGILLLSYDYDLSDPNDANDQKVLAQYQKRPDGTLFECKNCYNIRFWPKPNLPDVTTIAPPGSGKKELEIHETAMRMSGIVYIDKQHLYIRRHVGRLDGGYNALTSAVRVTMASIDSEQELRPELDNLIVMKYAEIMYQIRKVWINYETRNHIWRYSSYRLNQ
jgi:hypothetical protein